MQRCHPVLLCLGGGHKLGAHASGRATERERGAVGAMGSLHVDGERTVALVERQRGRCAVAAVVHLGTICENGLFIRRTDIDPPFARVASWPAAAVFFAKPSEHVVVAIYTGAGQYVNLHLFEMSWLVVTVCEAWREGDAGAFAILVKDKEESAIHVIASETNGTPRDVIGHAQTKVDVGIVVISDREGEGYLAIGRNEGGLSFIIIFTLGVIGRGERKKSWEMNQLATVMQI